MKKMFKKALSVLLAVLMVISVVPASVLTSASASAASLGYVVGDAIEFGSYPQSEVTDSAIISELESLTLDWVSYGFMSGDGEFGSMTESDYMKYADVELGGEKYRAVTFTQYRPNLTYHASSEKNSNQDDNGYYTDTVYWFRFEPLKWQIIDAEKGIIMSESLIDAQAYAETVYYHDNGDGISTDDYYLDSAHKTYANDYSEGSLREWLNDEFYSTAFSADEKSKILTYKADNSASASKYDSDSTRDHVFIPSSDDVNNADMGFASDSDRTATGTDYAKALGLYTPDSGKNSFWWLRTPGTYSYYACRVDNSGKTDEYGNSVDFTNYGVRPAIRYDFDGTGERYTATFMVDGEIYAQNSYAVGEAIAAPYDPVKEGYTFKEWDAVIPETMGYEDLTFNATWIANTYTVTFVAGEGSFADGETAKNVTADYGSQVNCIDDVPEKTGFEFSGWYDENGTPVTFPVTVTADITFTAHYAAGTYNVTYYVDDTVYTVQNYSYESEITAPEAPAKAGYVFKGWSKLPGGAVSEDLGTVTGNMSFYAVWSAGETSYKVNIYQMNTLGMYSTKATESKTLSGMTGETVTYTPEERAGFTLDSRSILSATVAGDGTTVIKVYYARNQYTLTIDGAEYILYYGATVPEEIKSVEDREGLEHIGYVDENGERAEIPEKMPAENLTLTSVWESVYYTLTFIVDGLYTNYNYAYGDYIETVETPTKEGYTFMGWSDTEGGSIVEIPDTMPAKDLTYYSVWERMAVSLVPADGSELVIDNDNMAITGVPEGITESEFHNALDVIGDGYYEITYYYLTRIGTGTIVSLYDNVTGDKVGDYTVVIMGDLDGDGVRTGADAKILVDEIKGITEWSDSEYYNYNVYLVMASDADESNGTIHQNDFYILGFETYDVKIYTMNSDGSYEETESMTGYGLVGETVSYTPDPAEDGFYIDTEKSVLSGVIPVDTILELSVYYAREQYSITYIVDGSEWATDTYLYGAQIDIPAEPVKEGHTFVGWTPEIPETMPAQDLYFEAVYEINMYTLTFDANGGLFADGSSNIVKYPLYDYGIEAPEDPEREGYVFSGWDDWVPMFMPAEDLTFTAVWSPATDIPYVVETYFMDTAGEYGEATVTNFTGTTDDVITLTPEEPEGFTFDAEKSVISGVIAADGSTVLKLYYARNTYAVTFTVDGEVYAESVYYYGSTLVEPLQPEREGYLFAGWIDADGNPAVFPITVGSDLTFTAVWTELITGTCGDNLTWTFDESTGELVITGEGAMSDYASYYECPWYDYCSGIKSVIIEEGITSIGDWAFCYCNSLTSVTISDSVTSIGKSAFSCCSNLTDITIPNGVTNIGESSFYSCTSLTSVIIPENVMSIGQDAFIFCNSLTGITVDSENPAYSCDENGVLFNKNKTALVQYPAGNTRTSYSVPDSVTSIGDYAFSDCDSLTSVTIGSSVTTIGNYVFSYCDSLTNITIPDNVTSIGWGAFYDCDNLTNVTIGNGVTCIEEKFFCYCTDLTSVSIGNNIISIGHSAFNFCESLTDVYYNGTEAEWNEVTIDSGNNCLTNATIHCVQSIIGTCGDNLTWTFNESTGELVISGEGAMSDYASSSECPWYDFRSSIKSVVIEEGITSIGERAFFWCRSLTSVTIPDSVTSIGDYAFYWCTSLTSVIIGNNVTSIGVDAFLRCKSLTSVTIPDSVTSIGDYAFGECIGLTSIEIPDSVTSIGDYAFSNCSSLTSVTIGNSVTSMGYGMFQDCDSLINITISDGVTRIGAGAFSYCTGLTSVTIPDGVTYIGKDAFSHCTSLTSVKIPDSVTSIDIYAFYYCSSLTSVTIPNSVTVIGGYAFAGCTSLTSVTIPNSVTVIGGYAFYVCHKLSDVYYTGTEEEWNAITIGSDNAPLTNATIHFESTGPAALSITTPENALASISNATASGTIDLSDADVSLEFTEAYYVGEQIFPVVYLQYGDELFDAKKELSVTYADNNKVGTAKAVLEGLSRFSGEAVLEFTISYEEIPETIVNATAVGEIGKISLSWGISSEVSTASYNIYRRNEGSDEYTLIKTVNGRENLSYTDTAVEEGKTYIYYITGVGTYGAESLPSAEIYATVQSDKEGPTVYKLKPASNTTLYATKTLSITAEDNIGIAKAVYSYSEDNGATWNVIGEATAGDYECRFDTTVIKSTDISVKVVVYDKAGNASEEVINTYKVDNIGPEKVTGLSAAVQSSIITLSWNNVADADMSYFILQQKINGTWTTVQSNLKTKGANVENLQAETEYTFRVACVDIRGNVGEFSDEFTAATAEDTMIPAITGQTPNPARYRSAFTYTATAQDDCGIATIKVQISLDEENWTDIGSKTFTDAAKSQKYSLTINTDEYNEGYIYVRAIATDISGNESISDAAAPYRGYYIDRTAPDAPTGLKASGADGYVSLEWTVGTENDLGGYYIYRATEENGEYTAIASNRAVYNYPDQTVERGKVYYYKIRVSDTCGNMSAYSEVVSAKMLDDTVKPVIRKIGETYNNSLSKNYNSFNVSASDNNMLSYMVVEYCTTKNMTYTEVARAESIADAYKNISVKIPMDGLESGDKVYVRAYAVDVMGLKSDYVIAQYTVDLTAPSASDFKATIVNDKVTLTWNDCRESDLAGFKIYRSENGKDYTLIGSRSVNSSGAYSFSDTVPTSESKTYYYKAEAVDSLGNASSVVTSVEYLTSADDKINTAPVAEISCKAYMILDVEEVFDASASTDDTQVAEYIWDFGDGTSSTEIKPVKKYSAVGTYTVTLTVKDAEGLQHTVTKTVEVKEREKLGTLNVRVVNEHGNAMPYVDVYFGMDSDNLTVIQTDSDGVATMALAEGTITVGTMAMKVNGTEYLNTKKDVVVLPNATRTVTLTVYEGDVIVGEFEVTRLDTVEEIKAAGIDPYDIENNHVIASTVRLTYGSTPVKVNYYNDGDNVVKYRIEDSDGNDIGNVIPSSGGDRKIVNITYLGNDTVAILDIPAKTQFLKEMFDVRLHITNNASTDFVLKQSEVVLNLPESGGLSLLTKVSDEYEKTLDAQIGSIRGQSTVTVKWMLRGEKAGEYDLTADFSGIFEEYGSDGWIHETFRTEEPIKVYGLDGVTLRILGADEIHNDTLYFNVELENQRDIDILMPDISVINNKIINVTDKALGTENAVFESTAYLRNIYVQLEDGKKQYLPIVYSESGNLSANLEVLAPGQKLVHEYVAYNAINYDGIAYFKDAAVIELEGMVGNVETGSFHKERYSFVDYSEKLRNIFSSSDPKVTKALSQIYADSNYYYVNEAESGKVMRLLYDLANTLINADPSGFENREMRDKARDILLSVLTDEDILGKIDELTGQKNYYAVLGCIDDIKAALEEKYEKDEVDEVYEELKAKADWLTEKYIVEGSIAFYDGVTSIIDNHLTSCAIEILQFTPLKHFGKSADTVLAWNDTILDTLTAAQRDVYVQGVLKFESNVQYSNFILDAILNASEVAGSDISSAMDVIVEDFKRELNQSIEDFNKHTAEIAMYATLEGSYHLMGMGVNKLMEVCFGSSVMSVVKVVYNFAMWALGIDDYMKQKSVLMAYNQIGDAFLDGFMCDSDATNDIEDFYRLTLLRAGCETRLGGEAAYKQFILDYINGKYLPAIDEAKALEKINEVMGKSYKSIDEWYDVVQKNIVDARDILFNIELTESNIPSAPSVTLDYENCQTVQTFGEEYEYCFGDGVWKSCNGKPVEFELKTVPQTLRVRVAASDTNLAGEITTVRIYAQKELSSLINVKYDGGKYIFGNLTPERSYEAVLLKTSISTPDWDESMRVSGNEISCDTESDYIALRSRPSESLLETSSIPLVLKVQKKDTLDLTIKGDGTVEQSNTSGEYFVGDIVDLTAVPHTGCEFLGWYVDGELVSKDAHYLLEYYEGVKVKAEFTGVTVKSIEIETMPSKTVYTVGETLSTDGMKLKVKYSDLSTKVIESGFVCSESVFAKDGETTVTVTYGGESTEFTVNVYKEYYILTWVVEGKSVAFEMKYGEVLDFEFTMDRPGYVFTGWTPEVPVTMPAHDVTLTATFKPETYDVIFDANGGVFADGSTDITVPVDYDARIAAPAAPEKQGYLFAGWSYNGKNLGENLGTMNRVGGMVFKAEWIAATDTVYTVETYTMNTAGEYVLLTQLFSGTTDETVTAEPAVGEGFELNAEKSVLSGAVAGDNSLVLKVYIDRLTYTLTVDNGIETVSDVYYYGAMLAPAETPAKTGYTFKGWDNEFPATMPAKDTTITAVFEANTYDAVFMNGSDAFATISVNFDEKITAPEGTPEKEGYNFIGWSLDGTIIVSDLGMMDETGKTFYAVWQAYSPDHEHIPHTVTVDATCTVDGIEYTICLECGETIGEAVVLPALNHSETQTVTVSESCTVAGMKYDVCVFCGETVGEAVVVPASGHKSGEWEITKNATCTENGEQIKKCTVCGETLETGVLEASGHKAGEWETTKNATCTENGEQIKKCTVCGETLETGVIEATGHKAGEWETAKNATCTENGEQIKKCTVCGEKLETKAIKAKGHTPVAEWTVVLEPTAKAEGKKIKKCTVCGKTAQEAAISKLETAHHEDTDIAIEYQPDDYKGKVSINVEETFDGGAFNIVNTISAKSQIYDITMTVDGVETQPQGKVTVRIPLPEGYNPKRSFVYHVDTKTGKVEKMNSRYENGYLVFETDHFSYYAVVDESQAGTAVDAALLIRQPSITTVKYGDTLILHAQIKGEIPDGARIEWSIDGEGMTIKPSADGTTCAVTSTAKGEVTVTAKLVDKNGNALNTSDGSEISAQQKLTSKAGFFQKLISFFKNLFKMNRIIEQVFKSTF